MISELLSALASIKEGRGIHLGEDTFLCEGGLDGSDKIYGFKRENGEFFVETRGCADGYPVREMVKSDLDHIFNQSEIFKRIRDGEYRSVPLDQNTQLQSLEEAAPDVDEAFREIKVVIDALENLSTNDLAHGRYKLKERLMEALESLGEQVDKGVLDGSSKILFARIK